MKNFPKASQRLLAVLAQLGERGLINQGEVFTTEFLRKEMNKRGWWLPFVGALKQDGFVGEPDNKALDLILEGLIEKAPE